MIRNAVRGLSVVISILSQYEDSLSLKMVIFLARLAPPRQQKSQHGKGLRPRTFLLVSI